MRSRTADAPVGALFVEFLGPPTVLCCYGRRVLVASGGQSSFCTLLLLLALRSQSHCLELQVHIQHRVQPQVCNTGSEFLLTCYSNCSVRRFICIGVFLLPFPANGTFVVTLEKIWRLYLYEDTSQAI